MDPRPDRQEIEAYKATKDAEARAAFIRSEADRDTARIRDAAFAEGYAAGIAAAQVEIHKLAFAVQDTKDTVTAFMQKVAPVLTKRPDALVKPVAAALEKSLDRIAGHLDDMSDFDESSSAGPGF
jgi:flagellar biosynthesis/type III secretory pathway protein FliH